MSDLLRLDGKVAVVTGGSSGIGAAVVSLLREHGAKVAVLDLNPGDDPDGFACDVSDPESVETTFSEIDARFGRVDRLVCCAGIGFVGDLLQTTAADFDRLMGVNARGVFLCCHAAVSRMLKSGDGGAIVNIASIASKVSLSERFAYSATKGAVLMMTRSIAQDYVTQNIRCNCVCPARVHTPLVDSYLARNYPGQEDEMLKKLSAAQPMGRMGETREIAALTLFLCSEASGYITGAAYDIDGGTLAMR